MSTEMQPGETQTPDPNSQERAPDLRAEKRKRIIITSITVVFGIALMFLVSRGGMCERYERKMERQKLMRNYIDSMRTESDNKKLR